jgi:D-alanyl-D-alanine carboxypeptidase
VSPEPSLRATALASPLASPGPSASPDPLDLSLPFDDATDAALQVVLDTARARIPTPGISVAIRLADGRTWLGVSGDRQLSPDRPVDQDTVFSIASITKTFVTAVVMQLVSEGRLGLDDHLSRFLPDYPRATRITIRQLLAHTSGVANYFESAAYNQAVFSDPSRRWKVRDILALVGKPYCSPGTCFHYSNTNFVLLGKVVQQVTGHTIAAEIDQRLLVPLGLEDTRFQPIDPTPRDAAHGHLWAGGTTFLDQTRGSRVLPNMSAATVAWAAGAMVSSPADLARWAMALYATDRVVPPDLLAQMLDFRKQDEYGLGTRTRIFNGRRAIGHGGSLRGYEDGIWYFPREGAVIVLLSNRGLYNPDRAIRELARTLWKHIDVPEPEYPRTKNTD